MLFVLGAGGEWAGSTSPSNGSVTESCSTSVLSVLCDGKDPTGGVWLIDRDRADLINQQIRVSNTCSQHIQTQQYLQKDICVQI